MTRQLFINTFEAQGQSLSYERSTEPPVVHTQCNCTEASAHTTQNDQPRANNEATESNLPKISETVANTCHPTRGSGLPRISEEVEASNDFKPLRTAVKGEVCRFRVFSCIWS